MTQYEYKVVQLTEKEYRIEAGHFPGSAADWLNRYGADGWCLMSRNLIPAVEDLQLHHFIFMRPVRNSP